MKIDSPNHFINRELSWLEFNGRVLAEGLSSANPLLERLKFLGIVSSNLDEFFMVRVGGLKQLLRARRRMRCPAGLTPRQQVTRIAERTHEMVKRQYACLNEEILPGLAAKGIICQRPETLEPAAARTAFEYFEEEVFPALTPIAADDGHFPRIAGLVMHVAVRLRKTATGRAKKGEEEKDQLALIQLPRNWPRFSQVPAESGYQFILLEDLVMHHIHEFFPGYDVRETAVFRLTRNADVPLQEDEASDLLGDMEDVLRERKSGSPVRLEVARGASRTMMRLLLDTFPIERKNDVYTIDGPLDLKAWMGLASETDMPGLRYPSYKPQPNPEFDETESMWEVIAQHDVLMHHPYEAFEPVVRILQDAADDPQVIAIKQTLYRTSSDSPIISALERAALNGKQVTALVELKARFDEDQNINWARRLTEAGAQVVYGVLRLKTHSKILMIMRRESEGIRRYVHLSTGNYHDKTARLYEDTGLFTINGDIGMDAANFFNAVTGYSEARQWKRLVIAPTGMRTRLYEMIDREISRSSPENPGLIMTKMNSLLDPEIIKRLYRASQAHVQVRLCIRGICALRPGIKGLSDNIEVISIVGRYLEHSRVIYFRNAGQEEVFLSSADWMPRNLDRRIEIMFPVLSEDLRQNLVGMLEVCFADNSAAWELRSDGSYERRKPARGEKARRAQDIFMERALERARESRLRQMARFQPKGPGGAPTT